ncbi:MAG: membrane protein insertase YidC [Bryobacteraceae bacterium]|nr:membrane protein insertase YidC [Bryobacteraceae bacterium]
MPDAPKGKPGTPKELPMELRLLIAFILMGVILFVTPYFYKPAPAPKPAAPEGAPATVAERAPAAAVKPPEVPPVAPPPRAAVSAAQQETVDIETTVYRIRFSNRGAVVRSWVLKDYLDGSGNPLDLVHQRGADKVGYPFSIVFPGAQPAEDPNNALFAVRRTEGQPGVDFEYSTGAASFRKSFQFREDSYLIEVTSEALENGRPVPHLLAWRAGFGDTTVPHASTVQNSLYFNVADNKLVVNDAKHARDGPITNQGHYLFAGIEDRYFAAAALPRDGSFAVRIYSDPIAAAEGEKEEPHVGVAIGGEGQNRFPIYIGPKDLDLLRKVDPKLQGIVDFGWFSFLAKPLFLGLKWIHNNWLHNYGWSIVLITVAINFVLMPLKITSLKSMKKMQALQPQIKAINERYKGISLRDPRKTQQNEEMMALYKKHGVNPMGGCMPMVLQIPFFIAFYKVLTVAIELRGAGWLWVTDLSEPEHLPIRILPIAMIVSQFIMQKMTPATSPDPTQQRIMMMMPLMMGFFFYGVSSGLVLYWLTSNVVAVFQQLLINKISPTPVPVVAESKPDAKVQGRRLRKAR